MSTTSDALRSIEQRAERAIAQELRLMMKEILNMRTGLTLEDRAHADALLLKLDRLLDDQVVRPIDASQQAAPALPSPDEWPQLPPGRYEVRFYSRDYGDLEDVATADTFVMALQLASEGHQAQPTDQSDALWTRDRGVLTVRSRLGTVLLHIEAVDLTPAVVQPHVARACQALEKGEPALIQQLFTALRQVA
ncbi:hypothetical protein [Roseateles flavus]|uniref:Uncharacterized protein n=1 Tax=Roseateles flavus TaxID=3149041 RepID=A0ABV0GGA3_9BURK